jgi:hypothetical protein
MTDDLTARAAREWRAERITQEQAAGPRLAVLHTGPPPSEDDYGAQAPSAPINYEALALGLPPMPKKSNGSYGDGKGHSEAVPLC